MTKRPNDETPAPDLCRPDGDICGIEERREAIRKLARRLFTSPLPTSALCALLNEDKAPLWAFAKLPRLADKEKVSREAGEEWAACAPQRRGGRELTMELLDATIYELQKELGRRPKAAEVCRRLSDKRGTTEDTEKIAVRRLFASIVCAYSPQHLEAIKEGIPGDYWDPTAGDCETPEEKPETLTEYIRTRTLTPEELNDLF